MSQSSFHIVVIDDDRVNNMLCTSVIKNTTGGLLPLCYTNPVEGLKYFEHEYPYTKLNVPTIVFLDINMPEMSGWEWLHKFEQLPQTIKQHIVIYMLSSSVSRKDIDLASSNTYVTAYIPKPLKKEKVLEILHSHHLVKKDEGKD